MNDKIDLHISVIEEALHVRRFLEELDLIQDAYGALEGLVAAPGAEAVSVYPLLYQLNMNFRKVLKDFGGQR